MRANERVELVGAGTNEVPIVGADVHTSVRLDQTVRRKVMASLTRPAQPHLAAAAPPAPDHVFLNLENVRGTKDSTTFDVYVGLPEGEKPADHPEYLAGSVGLFGVRKASKPDGEHGGQGLNYVLDITDVVDRLHLQNALDVDNLPVRVVPVIPVKAEDGIRVGRVSIYRQGV